MIILGSIIVLALFLAVGWAVSVEMFQQRSWRRRAELGDTAMMVAILEETMSGWRRARPPKGLPASLWAGVQGAQLVVVRGNLAVVSAAAEAEFRTEGEVRIQVTSALDQACAIAARLIDMLLYDVPNLRLEAVRVDAYTTFTGADGQAVQRPILSATAGRAEADRLTWEALTPVEILGRFNTVYDRGPGGQGLPIDLPALPALAEDAADLVPGVS